MNAARLSRIARDWTETLRREAGRIPPEPQAAQDVEDMLLATLYVSDMLRHMWKQVTGTLAKSGFEAGAIREFVGPALETAEIGLSILENVPPAVGTLPAFRGEWVGPLPDIATAIRELGAIRTAAESLRDHLNRPPPPLDKQFVQDARAAYARGEGEDLGDLLAGLKEDEAI